MTKVKKTFNTDEVQITIKQLVRQTFREVLEVELEEFLSYKKYEEQILRTTETDIVLKLLNIFRVFRNKSSTRSQIRI